MSERRRHDEILRGAHGREFENDFGAAQPVRSLGDKVAVVEMDDGAQGFEPGLVHVESAGADSVTAGKSHMSGPHPCSQRSEDGDRGPHGADEFVVGLDADFSWDVDVHDALDGIVVDLAAEADEQLHHDPHVEDSRDIRDGGASHGQQTCGHEFEDAVLGASDIDGSRQLCGPGQAEDIH